MKEKYRKISQEEIRKKLEIQSVDYIQEYHEMLNKKTCDYFIKKHKQLEQQGLVKDGTFNVMEGENEDLDKDIKNSRDIFLSSQDINKDYLKKNISMFNMNKNDKDKKMFEMLSQAVNKSIYMYCLHTGMDSPWFAGITQDFFDNFFQKKSKIPKLELDLSVESICLRKYIKNKG